MTVSLNTVGTNPDDTATYLPSQLRMAWGTWITDTRDVAKIRLSPRVFQTYAKLRCIQPSTAWITGRDHLIVSDETVSDNELIIETEAL